MTDPIEKLVLFRVRLEKPVPDLESLAAQRCWSIEGVAACDPVAFDSECYYVDGVSPDALVLKDVRHLSYADPAHPNPPFKIARTPWESAEITLLERGLRSR